MLDNFEDPDGAEADAEEAQQIEEYVDNFFSHYHWLADAVWETEACIFRGFFVLLGLDSSIWLGSPEPDWYSSRQPEARLGKEDLSYCPREAGFRVEIQELTINNKH